MRMGSFLDKPKTEKHNEHGDGNGLVFSVSSMQGWRCEMEDAHHAQIGLGLDLETWNFFAVFDGHAGVKVSEHCSTHLLNFITDTDEFKQKDITKGIHAGFLKLDDSMRDLPDFAAGVDKSGTTVVCAFISPDHVYIANCGDSRAVISRNGVPVYSTQDHKPVLPEEKERIINAGGTVMVQRVNGSLAVSRALGDYEYKQVKDKGQCEQLVSPEPEVFCHKREPDDEFLILACDGIWDVMSNEDVCSFVQSRLKITSDLVDITNSVIDTCLHKGSRDNMSIIIIKFPGAPTPTPEAIQAENELEAILHRKMQAIVSLKIGCGSDYGSVLRELTSYSPDIVGLPPGGGIESKSTFLAKIYKDLCPDQADECEQGNYFQYR